MFSVRVSLSVLEQRIIIIILILIIIPSYR